MERNWLEGDHITDFTPRAPLYAWYLPNNLPFGEYKHTLYCIILVACLCYCCIVVITPIKFKVKVAFDICCVVHHLPQEGNPKHK